MTGVEIRPLRGRNARTAAASGGPDRRVPPAGTATPSSVDSRRNRSRLKQGVGSGSDPAEFRPLCRPDQIARLDTESRLLGSGVGAFSGERVDDVDGGADTRGARAAAVRLPHVAGGDGGLSPSGATGRHTGCLPRGATGPGKRLTVGSIGESVGFACAEPWLTRLRASDGLQCKSVFSRGVQLKRQCQLDSRLTCQLRNRKANRDMATDF